MPKIFVLHENAEWMAPLRAALDTRKLAFEEWHLAEGAIDLSDAPPEGVFYNRMSASSHTRGHRFAPEFTGSVLAWLQAHGRRVVNGGRALELEVSKVKQYLALNAVGIPTPPTQAAVGADALRDAVRKAETPFILKPNRGGKGLGVQLFQTTGSALAEIDKGVFEDAPDGTMLVQRYIAPAEPVIIRNEFVGGEHVYSVRVDTSGGFLLCPADVCNLPDSPQGFQVCPADGGAAGGADAGARPKFEILPGFTHPLHARMTRFLERNSIEVAGIEMIVDTAGKAWVYDINTNTNYNPDAEAAAGLTGTDRSGMGALAAFLGRELEQLHKLAAAD
ncbi:MAG: alpha-L-glutamate ligase [Alphaproteobacteria bacterium]|nr:alpha-L-glutamate ligase [Alphaproteobacteria bacterium]